MKFDKTSKTWVTVGDNSLEHLRSWYFKMDSVAYREIEEHCKNPRKTTTRFSKFRAMELHENIQDFGERDFPEDNRI